MIIFETRSLNLVYAFGMPIQGRKYSSNSYKYGFNGQLKDDEIYGAGNLNSALFWEYDTRLGRRWNVDPEPFAFMSNYSCFANNPFLLTDPLGNRVKYGSENSTRAERRRIKDQVKDERKNDSSFDAEFKAQKKDKDMTFVYDDMAENVNGANGKTAVTGATIHDRVIGTPVNKNDKDVAVAWNIRLINLPDKIEFTPGETYMQNEDDIRGSINASDMGMNKTFSHKLIDDPIKSQIALWLAVDESNSITITINIDGSGRLEGATSGNKMISSSRLGKLRGHEIKSAFKSVPPPRPRLQRGRIKRAFVTLKIKPLKL